MKRLGVLLCLILAAPAAAAVQDSTILVDSPLGALPADSVNDAEAASRTSIDAAGERIVFESDSDGLLPPGADPTVTHVFVRDRLAQTTTMVDLSAAGVPGNAIALTPAISADGQKVAFVSGATNLTADTVSGSNVFVKTLATGAIELAHLTEDDTPGDGPVSAPVLDADGSIVAFVTYGQLVSADTNDRPDVYTYTRDLANDTTTAQSVTDGGVFATDEIASSPTINGNGDVVAFSTSATLEGLDTNGLYDVYTRTGAGTTLESINAAALAQGSNASTRPQLSASGLELSFESVANDLVAGDTNGRGDVFVRTVTHAVNRTGGSTELVSRPDGSDTLLADDASADAGISRNGNRVIFTSEAGNLVTGFGPTTLSRAYVRVLATNNTIMVARATGGTPIDGAVSNVAIDTDGSALVLGTDAENLGPPGLDASAVHVRLPGSGTTALASGPTGSSSPLAETQDSRAKDTGAISADGGLMVFASGSDGLAGAAGEPENVFLKDVSTGALTLLTPGADGDSTTAVISDDGSTVAYATEATNLGLPAGVHVYDVATGARVLASRADGAAGAPITDPDDNAGVAIDADGSHVAFVTDDPLAGAGDANNDDDVYVRDVDASTTVLGSSVTGASPVAGDGDSDDPALDASGTKLAFTSEATDLGDGDTNGTNDVHLRDLGAGTTTLVTRANGEAIVSGDGNSQDPSISADGTKVAFQSDADNLDAADTNAFSDVFVRDVVAGTTTAVSRDLAIGDSFSFDPAISRDGTRVAFETLADNLHPLVTGSVSGVLIRTLATGVNTLVSRADGASGAAAASPELASLSADGGCVGFTTTSTGLQPGGGYPSPDYEHVHMRAVAGECPRPAPVVTPDPTPTVTTVSTVEPTVTPTPTVTPDTTAPVISKVKVSRKRVSFALSEDASVRVTAHRGKKRKFRRTRDFTAGANRIRFKPKLKQGRRYKVKLRATDAAGNQSAKSKRFPKR